MRKRLETVYRLEHNPYIPHTPFAKQLAFLLLDCEEAFYGGAAGPGKTDGLLMAALMYVQIPGYAAILFRRTFKDLILPGALMDRAREWLTPTDAHWRDAEMAWHFPAGASLSFGYMDNDTDHFRYQGMETQFCGWDELTQFKEFQYRYMFSRLRRLKGSTIPIRMRSASNPGGIGHDWVKQRLIVEGRANGRVFIPAKLDDNPYLDREAYLKSLAELDPITRAQLLAGDWSARASGTKFRREWFEVVDAAPADLHKVRRWDMAATEAKKGRDPDWTVGLLLGISQSTKCIYVLDIRRVRANPGGTELLIKQTAELDGRAVPIRMEQEPGSAGVKAIDDYRKRVLMGWDFRGVPSTGSKEIRANPVSSQAQAGNVKLLRGQWVNAFLDEADSFPNGAHDDQIDALSGALADLTEDPEPQEEIVIYDSMQLVSGMRF